MIPRQNGWSDRDLNMFMKGFITRQAQELHEQGLFTDLKLDELVNLIIQNYVNEKGELK